MLSFQTVQLAPIFGSSGHPLLESIQAAAAAGFTNIGLDKWSVRAYLDGDRSLESIPEELDTYGLRCTDVVGLLIRQHEGDVLAEAGYVARLARGVGAPLVLVAFDASVRDWRTPRLRQMTRGAIDVLADHGIRAAVEFIPYTSLGTVADAWELCDELGWARAGLCLDAFHALLGGQLPDVASLSARAVAMVQLGDSRAEVDELQDASRHHRLIPGEGDLAVSEFVQVLKEIGFTGLVSSEVLSVAARNGPATPFAFSCHQALARVWGH